MQQKESFLDMLQNTITSSPANLSVTENGAVGFKSTGKKILDLNFAVSSLRSKTDSQVESMFANACSQNVDLAIVWLFYARDIRGGLGERRLFRIGMKYLAREYPQKVRKILPLIAEYGRWDDVVVLLDTKVRADAANLIRTQLMQDMTNLRAGKSISLLAKWLPSATTSSAKTRKKAAQLCGLLECTHRSYRLMLSRLRKKLRIVEIQMSQNKWEEIDYQAVPSRANLLYNNAFLKHDETRRRAYLGALEKGEAKINASTLFPHDILQKYNDRHLFEEDPVVEGLWKALPNTIDENASTIVVADGSGSMCSRVGNTKVTALTVANALAIYFAERLHGPYRNRYITFSDNPQLVDLSGASTLYGKNKIARQHSEVANTNIEAVFDLILETAVQNRLRQQDLPANILIISDMEFDSCATCNATKSTGGWMRFSAPKPMPVTLFDTIREKYRRHGFTLPRLIFWNVNSRTGTIPVMQNELGVALVSGFSPNVAKMAMSGQLDPMNALLETLASERYRPVVEALVS